MDWMDGIGVIAGILAGVSSGFLSAVATPFATRRAEEIKAWQAARRALVGQGRALVDDGTKEQWSPPRVARDSRYRELRRHLPVSVQKAYNENSDMLYAYGGGGATHTQLADEIDRLERKWKLV